VTPPPSTGSVMFRPAFPSTRGLPVDGATCKFGKRSASQTLNPPPAPPLPLFSRELLSSNFFFHDWILIEAISYVLLSSLSFSPWTHCLLRAEDGSSPPYPTPPLLLIPLSSSSSWKTGPEKGTCTSRHLPIFFHSSARCKPRSPCSRTSLCDLFRTSTQPGSLSGAGSCRSLNAGSPTSLPSCPLIYVSSPLLIPSDIVSLSDFFCSSRLLSILEGFDSTPLSPPPRRMQKAGSVGPLWRTLSALYSRPAIVVARPEGLSGLFCALVSRFDDFTSRFCPRALSLF